MTLPRCRPSTLTSSRLGTFRGAMKMAVRRRLVITDSDTSAAILSAFETMPPGDQVALIATLQPKQPRLRWLEPLAVGKVIAILEGVDQASRDLIENRLLPPSLHRFRRQTERYDAICVAGWLYTEERTGWVAAKEIAAHCRRLPPPRDPR